MVHATSFTHAKNLNGSGKPRARVGALGNGAPCAKCVCFLEAHTLSREGSQVRELDERGRTTTKEKSAPACYLALERSALDAVFALLYPERQGGCQYLLGMNRGCVVRTIRDEIRDRKFGGRWSDKVRYDLQKRRYPRWDAHVQGDVLGSRVSKKAEINPGLRDSDGAGGKA